MTARALCCAAVLVLLLAGCGGGEVGGTVSGLGAERSVTLLNNGGDALGVRRNGSFTFSTALDANSAYAVTVGTQPAGQSCSVANGSGSIDADGRSVDNVEVSCAFAATLRGTVSGLQSGVALTLGNGGERIAVAADGAFAFGTLLPDGTRYDVQVITQPALGSCSVRNGSGVFFADSFTDIVVSCG
ncbi:MAG TPA: hypothetical protein PKB14_16685 [Rubrivivax sp.]|nr:hypothetical protein [Rubrivivax sp.]